MKHLTIADKSLLAGDEVVDLLVEYATLLAQQSTADHVDLRALDTGGDEVIATFLLSSGTSIVAETASTNMPEPDNHRVEQYMHDRIAEFRGLGADSPEDISGHAVWNTAAGE